MRIAWRPATDEDCRLIFDWANDPQARSNSARPEPIPWESHVEWYAARLADPGCEIWIAADEAGTPVGQVRFEVAGDEAEIGVSVAAGRRGGGLGTRLIREATDDFFRRRRAAVVVAYIRHHNLASQRAFAAAGFEPAGEGVARGVLMLRYERRAQSR